MLYYRSVWCREICGHLGDDLESSLRLSERGEARDRGSEL